MSVSSWFGLLRGWDESGFHLINGSLRNRLFDLLMPFISNKWNFAIPAVVLLGYVLIFRPKRDRIIVIVAVAVILLTNETSLLLKDLFQRTRPVLVPYDAVRPRSFSFPSSHASNMFALAVFLSYNYRRLGWICFPAAALVGYSRIYVGSHYPMDVLGGAIWGVLIGLLSAVAARRFMPAAWVQQTGRPERKTKHPIYQSDSFH